MVYTLTMQDSVPPQPSSPVRSSRIPEKKEIITPKFQDMVLFDERTGEPFVFSAKQQEYFTDQGLQTIPNKTPARRKENELKRYEGKELIKVTCKVCKKIGKVLQEVADPEEVYCDECFAKAWQARLDSDPVFAAQFAEEEAAADAELERLKQESELRN